MHNTASSITHHQIMSTYYLLDANSNTWSRKHVPLRAILAMPGITDNHLLANAQTRQTLTVAEACAANRKPRLKTPEDTLLKWNKPTTRKQPQKTTPIKPAAASTRLTKPTSLSAQRTPAAIEQNTASAKEYKVLDRSDQHFGGFINATTLAHTLNTYASQGWKVLSCHLGNMHTTPNETWEDLLIIMERSI